MQITFAVASAAPIAVQVDVVREATRKPVVSFALPAAAPGAARRAEWDGLTGAGAPCCTATS